MFDESEKDLPALAGCPGKPDCDEDCLCHDHGSVYRWMQRREEGWRKTIIAAREARDRADLQVHALKRALYAECRGEACSPDCAGGGYRGCAGCDRRAKMACGEDWEQAKKSKGDTDAL